MASSTGKGQKLVNKTNRLRESSSGNRSVNTSEIRKSPPRVYTKYLGHNKSKSQNKISNVIYKHIPNSMHVLFKIFS